MTETNQLRTKKMVKEKEASVSPLLRELFQMGLYKRSQGRIARQVTLAALWLIAVLGAWRLGVYLNYQMQASEAASVGVALTLAVVGCWVAFRAVNLPSFADFLIAVEAEMNKVSWPSRGELIRSSIVVIFSIVFLAVVLFCYDVFWSYFLEFLGVVRRGR